MKLLINYSDHRRYYLWQKLNSETAIGEGLFDKVIAYGPQDIDADFREKNKKILSVKRGGGYWLWKPYILKKALADLEYGDFVFYLDCDHFFVSSVMPLIETCLRTQQDIIPFQLEYMEKRWTKRDAFILMDCDKPKYTDTRQNMATAVLLRKSDFSERFVDEWLTYAQDERIISDKPNQCGYPNYPRFHENRHDQSIYSLLTKKYSLQDYDKLKKHHHSRKNGMFDFVSWVKSPPSLEFDELTKKYPILSKVVFRVRFCKIVKEPLKSFLVKVGKLLNLPV